MSSVAFFIWSWNSAEWLPECISSFRRTTDAYLLGIHNASTDGSGQILWDECDMFTEEPSHVSIVTCVNMGYEALYREGFDYIGFIHPDQLFFQYDWVEVLVKTLDTYPQIGKISASNTRVEDRIESKIYPGAEAANLIRRDQMLHWDEKYLGYGGYEDWDMHQQYVSLGLASCITPGALMWHQGMGTRTLRPKDEADALAGHNGQIYHSKWNTWEAKYAPDDWQDVPVVR